MLKCAVVVNSPWFAHAMTRINDRIFVRIGPHTAVVFGWDPWKKQHSILGKVARFGFLGKLRKRFTLVFPNHPWDKNYVQPKNHVEQHGVVFFLLSGLFCTSMAKSRIIVFSDDSNGRCSHWFLSAVFESPFAKDVESFLKRLYLYGASLTSEVKAVKTQGQMPLKRKLWLQHSTTT